MKEQYHPPFSKEGEEAADPDAPWFGMAFSTEPPIERDESFGLQPPNSIENVKGFPSKFSIN